jgi:serine/threonine-protein kinase
VLQTGIHLGPYEILAPLGAGGMGEVYRARDTRLGRDVAVKVLPPHFAGDLDRRQRFEREARAVAALSHANILALHDVGSQFDITFLVLELLEGESLRERLHAGPLPWRKAVELGAGIADGLSAAHAKGVIHRDLKPENLFVTTDGRVKILDFGLARVGEEGSPHAETGPYSPSPTQTGTVMGTIGYMSPEQVRGQPLDARSDIFSLGCVLHEMISGRPPFARETSADTQTAILREEPPPLTQSRTEQLPELDRVIRHCLEKNREERFQTARDLGFALRATLSPSGPVTVTTKSTALPWLVGLAALLVAVCIAGGIYRFTRDGPDVEPTPPASSGLAFESVAVLPFVNEAADPKAAFLGDGMTISLVNGLSQVRDLKVRPFSSVARYKSGDSDPLTAGRELKVEAVLTGRIQMIDEDLLITVELIDVSQQRSVWIEQYQRKYANLLAVQQEIARASTAQMRLRLSGEEAVQLARQPTQNLEAFRLYILGRVEWNKRTEDGVNKGITYFEQAIQEDSNYALAYAGLADCYVLLAYNHVISPKEALGKARAAAEKALGKDANLAEAHTSLARIQTVFERDWAGAERRYQQAIQLRPTYATAHHWYSIHLAALGRHDEAVAAARQAEKLDPSSLIINNTVGAKFYYARRPDEAIKQYRKTLAIDPNFPPALYHLGLVYAQQGRYPEAITEFQKAHQHSKQQTLILGFLGYAHAKSGQESQARKLLAELQELAKRSYVSSYSMALIHMGLGDKDQAFSCLHQAIAERDPWLLLLKVAPLLDELRADPRFAQLLQDMGLADKAAAKDQPLDTLAVLPFDNQSTDPEAGYLSDDITFSLTESLGRFRDLKVRSFSSASRFKDRSKGHVQAGRELQVPVVLTGTIQRRGEELVIFVELVDVQLDQPLWKQRYAGKFADRLTLQRDIVKDIPDKLRLALTGQQRQDLAVLPTKSLKAHELYVQGRLEWNKRTDAGMRTAIDLLKRAIAADPGFAAAYAGLADAYLISVDYGVFTPKEILPKARTALAEALRLEPELAEAHATQGFLMEKYDWDWRGAEEAFQRSIRFQPNYATAHHWYSRLLVTLRRTEQALAEARRAKQLDPHSAIIDLNVGWVLIAMNRTDGAIHHLQGMIQTAPNFAWVHQVLAYAYAVKGRRPEAIQAIAEALRLDGSMHFQLEAGLVYALVGREEEARRVLTRAKEAAMGVRVSPVVVAAIHLALGDQMQAMDLLEAAFLDRDPDLSDVPGDPYWTRLHGDTRFQALLRKMNFPP